MREVPITFHRHWGCGHEELCNAGILPTGKGHRCGKCHKSGKHNFTQEIIDEKKAREKFGDKEVDKYISKILMRPIVWRDVHTRDETTGKYRFDRVWEPYDKRPQEG